MSDLDHGPMYCMGRNCGTTTAQHSPECILETAIIQGWSTEATLAAAKAVFDARATLSPAHIEDGEEVEVVGYRVSMPGEPELGTWLDEEAEEEPQIQHHEPLMTVAQHQRIVAARASKAAARVEDEREEFDCWFRREEGLPESADTTNISAAYLPWKAWKARAALSAPSCPCQTDTARETRRKDDAEALELQRILFERHQDCRPLDAGLMGWAAAALSAPPAAGVPDGYVLVPLEPTAEMVEAGMEVDIASYDTHFDETWAIYEAMVKAALTPMDAATPPASEQWHCQHCNSSTAEACRDVGCFGVDAEPASEQQRAVVMPEKQVEYIGDRDHRQWASGANWMLREFLRLNPHLAKGEGV